MRPPARRRDTSPITSPALRANTPSLVSAEHYGRERDSIG